MSRDEWDRREAAYKARQSRSDAGQERVVGALVCGIRGQCAAGVVASGQWSGAGENHDG